MVPVFTAEGTVDERETVFQTWSMLADRSPTRTAAKVCDEFGIAISPDVVRKWSTRHWWAERAAQLFQDTAPTYFECTRATLIAAGPPAATYLLSVVSGEAKPDKNMIVASVAALDRIGFLPQTGAKQNGAKPQLPPPSPMIITNHSQMRS